MAIAAPVFATGCRVADGSHHYTPTVLNISAPGIDAPMKVIHMTGGALTTLILAKERASGALPARRADAKP
jgi:hypothetical protein